MNIKYISLSILAILAIVGVYIFSNQNSVNPEILIKEDMRVEVVAQDLNIPWEVAFLGDEDILITERPGVIKRINSGAVINIQGVRHVGEGGLLGMALHPDFKRNNLIYIYLTTSSATGTINRVERYRIDLDNNSLFDRTIVIDNIPGSQYHDGGRIAFGPDKNLYITTGDAGQPSLAQDKNSLAGKILRIEDDGSIPSDNPFKNAVYSYGHRNPQGLAWDSNNNLWASEHGRSGLSSGYDEINLILSGANYGWPDIEGDEKQAGVNGPIIHSGADTTWAPSGMAIVDDELFFSGLRGEAVYRSGINSLLLSSPVRLLSEYGRIRNVTLGPDGNLYVLTSNRDGRGSVGPGDDKLLRIINF